MKSKKILSAVMASAIAMSLAVPAFAADPAPSTPANQTVVTAAYKEPNIEVTVPTTAQAVINPYKLPVQFKMAADGTVTTQSTGKDIQAKDSAIATQPMTLVNLCDSDLDVSAAIAVTLPETTELKFVEESAFSATTPLTNKSIYMVVEGTPIASSVYDADADTFDLDAYKTAWEALDWSTATKSNAATIKAGTAKKIGTLDKATIDADDGSVTALGANALAVRLAGKAVEEPKTPWAAADTFTATIAYTFKVAAPAANPGD